MKRERRLDHSFMYMCVMLGLLGFSVVLMYIGPIASEELDELTEFTQNVLAICLFCGSLTCISGFLIGAPIFYPKKDYTSLAYTFPVFGCPAVTFSLEYYAWAFANDSSPLWVGILGTLCTSIGLGALATWIDFIREIAKLERARKEN